jgi:hypothetical protein
MRCAACRARSARRRRRQVRPGDRRAKELRGGPLWLFMPGASIGFGSRMLPHRAGKALFSSSQLLAPLRRGFFPAVTVRVIYGTGFSVFANRRK